MTTQTYGARSRRSTDTELVIIEMARDLLAEKGLEGLSMRAVAKRAGVSATAIYHYFANKRELVEQVVILGFHRFDAYLKNAIATHAPGSLERLIALGEAYIQFAFDHRQHFRVIFDMEAIIPKPIDELPGHGGFKLLKSCVQEAVESGAIKPGDPDLISLYLWSLAHGVVTLSMACQLHGNPSGNQSSNSDFQRELLNRFSPFIREGLESPAIPSGTQLLNDRHRNGISTIQQQVGNQS